MGRWKPKKPRIPEWAIGAPKHLVSKIVEDFPKFIPPYSMVRQIFAQLDEDFLAHFGRMPVEGDPVFFDRSCAEPRPVQPEEIRRQICETALLCGIEPAYIHAFQEVGVWVTLEQLPIFIHQGDIVFDWVRAVETHRNEFPPDA